MTRHLSCIALIFLSFAATASPTTIDNDDSCDISVLPAATLLLPYFEVDLSTRNGEDTLFTITNVGRDPQIARVTIWTDLSYPLYSFNIFLTGYDAQSISLYDVIGNGAVAPPSGTSTQIKPGDDPRRTTRTGSSTCRTADSQNWVIVSMRAEGRFSTDFDAVALGNGCTPSAPVTAEDGALPAIGPAPNATSVEARVSPSTINNDDACDVSLLPAATLLLPYFEIDLHRADGETTVFRVTNVSQLPQIARATVWTDRAYPLLHFYIYLTGYDVQTINLYDIFANGIIAPPDGTTSETEPGERSLDENPLLETGACDRLAVAIPPAIVTRVLDALTTGLVDGCVLNRVGNLQPDGHARGYVTIDVVRSCESAPAGFAAADYFSSELLFDNVLTGDYQQVDAGENRASCPAALARGAGQDARRERAGRPPHLALTAARARRVREPRRLISRHLQNTHACCTSAFRR